ncbi:hypothetical protein EOS_35690 [Caballeronia mineralivorans PML1(12)]|uniref:Uncharacterized protein n=1 Tax=Caballeronia mineralivorans PML1(12) TaxID=908627 RepID=A0A0J1FP37_9BURK|nr:hypothetical protein EOS_35690 [Caballeronia mineralivorans PML1(12)]
MACGTIASIKYPFNVVSMSFENITYLSQNIRTVPFPLVFNIAWSVKAADLQERSAIPMGVASVHRDSVDNKCGRTATRSSSNGGE